MYPPLLHLPLFLAVGKQHYGTLPPPNGVLLCLFLPLFLQLVHKLIDIEKNHQWHLDLCGLMSVTMVAWRIGVSVCASVCLTGGAWSILAVVCRCWCGTAVWIAVLLCEFVLGGGSNLQTWAHLIHGFACSWTKKAGMMQNEQLEITMITSNNSCTGLQTSQWQTTHNQRFRSPRSAPLCFHWPLHYPHGFLFTVEIVNTFRNR